MKNNILFALLACSLFLFSCGTMTRTAQNTQPGFVNSIYYTPDQAEELAYNQSKAELEEIQKATTSFLDGNRQTIYIGDTNVVDIDYNPSYTYSIVDDQESYEARLRKFDSPVYTVNIEWDQTNYYDWYNWNNWYSHSHWGWYNPWYRYSSWYNPWYRYSSWYNPWYCGYGYGWYDPWYTSSWYSPYYGWYDPWWGHGWAPAPFPNHHQPHRDIYYGHRDSAPSYNATAGRGGSSYNRNMANVSQIRGNGTKNSNASNGNVVSNGVQSANRGGSAYRRGNSTHNGVVYNNAAANAGSNSSNTVRPSGTQTTSKSSSQGSMYRRSASQNTRSSAASSNQQNAHYQSSGRNQNSNASNNNSNNSYYRNSNYDRGTSNNYNSAPVRSSGSSSGSYNNQRSGGSSYRR